MNVARLDERLTSRFRRRQVLWHLFAPSHEYHWLLAGHRDGLLDASLHHRPRRRALGACEPAGTLTDASPFLPCASASGKPEKYLDGLNATYVA
jgi:hypothetical protein